MCVHMCMYLYAFVCAFDGSNWTTAAGVEEVKRKEQRRMVVEDMQNLDVRMWMCDKKQRENCSGRGRSQ